MATSRVVDMLGNLPVQPDGRLDGLYGQADLFFPVIRPSPKLSQASARRLYAAEFARFAAERESSGLPRLTEDEAFELNVRAAPLVSFDGLRDDVPLTSSTVAATLLHNDVRWLDPLFAAHPAPLFLPAARVAGAQRFGHAPAAEVRFRTLHFVAQWDATLGRKLVRRAVKAAVGAGASWRARLESAQELVGLDAQWRGKGIVSGWIAALLTEGGLQPDAALRDWRLPCTRTAGSDGIALDGHACLPVWLGLEAEKQDDWLLQLAALDRDADCAQMADPIHRCTALHAAALRGWDEAAGWLVARGVSPLVADAKGRIALDVVPPGAAPMPSLQAATAAARAHDALLRSPSLCETVPPL